jgi:cephalosporin-C deacetylase
MPLVEWSLSQLREYEPDRLEPDDFDEFWAKTLADVNRRPLSAEFTKVQNGLAIVDTYDVSFAGYGGDRIKAWLAIPAGTTEPVPCVVEFPGYGGGRGLPHDVLLFAAAGYAHLFLDIRGQGSGWRPGETPDREPEGGNAQHPGFMTRGVLDPHTYYYRRVVSDAVRAVEAARAHPLVDASRTAVAGMSQGGGLSLMVAGLVPDLAAVLSDVPFLCHYERALEVASDGPYLEIEGYLKIHRDHNATVFATLAYFDGLNFAARANAPALISVGLTDPICPPSTVFAAHHHYAGPKRLEVFRFNAHEGGGTFHVRTQLEFLAQHLRFRATGERHSFRATGERQD